jgi:hypothetical protein
MIFVLNSTIVKRHFRLSVLLQMEESDLPKTKKQNMLSIWRELKLNIRASDFS